MKKVTTMLTNTGGQPWSVPASVRSGPVPLAFVVVLRWFPGSMSSSSIPPKAPYSDLPLPSLGSLGAGSPISSVLSAYLRLLDHLPSSLRCLRSPGTLPRVLFASIGRTPLRWTWAFSHTAPAPPSSARSDQALPGSWATLAYMPRSSTPAEGWCQANTASPLLPSVRSTTSAPHSILSRLHHAAYTPPVYASQSGSLLNHATLGSGWWPALAG